MTLQTTSGSGGVPSLGASQALEEAQKTATDVSAALRRASRKALRPPVVVSGGGGFAARRGTRAFFLGLVWSFVALVLVPFVVGSLYFGLIASDQYASEVRFVVRNGEQSPLDALSGLTGLPQGGRFQDAQIVANYVKSAAMVDALEKMPGLRRIFTSSKADFFARLAADDPAEDVLKYWRKRIDVDIDDMSGIVAVNVRAFTPDDSFALAQEIIRNSETMVNALSERARADALAQAGKELGRAEQQLRTSVDQLRRVRNSEGMIDATATAEGFSKITFALRKDLAQAEDDFRAQSGTVSEDAPQMRVLAAKIAALKQQIAKYERDMAGSVGGERSLSDSLSSFDLAKLSNSFAQEQYVRRSAGYETARADASTHQIYLSTTLRPTLPQKALYPKRLLWWSIVVGGSLLLWGLGAGLAFTIRDHLAA